MPTLDQIRRDIASAVDTARATTPLAGSITNFVTVDFVANAQLAAGGSAAMVYLPDEGEALAAMSGAFYVNLGTMLPSHEQTMCRTVDALAELGTPWVLDPVGIGMGQVRANVLAHMRTRPPAVIRCNASEAIALAASWGLDVQAPAGGVRGVDATDGVDAARDAAIALARHTGGAVAVSGPVDLVTDGHVVARLAGGSPLMERVTGFGCALGGVVAVYAAGATPLASALAASAAFDLAATRATERTAAPASFKVAFLDALFEATSADIAANPLTIEEV